MTLPFYKTELFQIKSTDKTELLALLIEIQQEYRLATKNTKNILCCWDNEFLLVTELLTSESENTLANSIYTRFKVQKNTLIQRIKSGNLNKTYPTQRQGRPISTNIGFWRKYSNFINLDEEDRLETKGISKSRVLDILRKSRQIFTEKTLCEFLAKQFAENEKTSEDFSSVTDENITNLLLQLKEYEQRLEKLEERVLNQ